MRCSSENKFASFDTTELEIQSDDLNGSTIDYEIHLNRPCALCGQEAASADLQLSVDIDHTCEAPDPADSANWLREDILWGVPGHGTFEDRDDALQAAKDDITVITAEWDDSEPEFDLNDSDVEEVDTMQSKDRHGKPITNYRYAKHLIGAHVTAHLSCQRCGEDFDAEGEDTLAASEFEDAGH
jgi:hypothetical protein